MYLDFFNLNHFPFNQCPDIDYYYTLKSHQESLNVLLIGLQNNDGIIKITGEPGTGKSLLCRLLIEKISENYYPIYIINPYVTYNELLQAIAADFKILKSFSEQNNDLLTLIYNKAVELKNKNIKVVLIFDEAQCLSPENLELIRIFSNLESGNDNLFQIIIIGGLELDGKLKQLNHFTQRISFSHKLLPIKKQEINNYIFHRIGKASKPNTHHGINITSRASKLLHKKTEGIPRLVNIVCHKALLLAYSKNKNNITKNFISKAISDTECINRKKHRFILSFLGMK